MGLQQQQKPKAHAEATVPHDFKLLSLSIASLPEDKRAPLLPLLDKAQQAVLNRRQSISDGHEEISRLAFENKLIRFEVEEMRNQRDEYLKLLNNGGY